MCDYCSESEALAEREDDNCEFCYDDYDDYYSGAAWRDYDYPIRQYHRKSTYIGRKPMLGNKNIEKRKAKAEKAKTGERCRCAMCAKFFEKKSYQQKFCSDKCRIKYHNKRKVYV